MRKRSLVLLAGVAAIVASLVVGPAATAGPQKASAGTVVFIHDQEPPSLRANWVDNNLYATALVVNNIWYGGQIRDNNAKWVTRLFTGPPKLVKRSPLTVSFQYSPKANWSDGTPVTCADWRATWQVFVNPKNNVVSRTGYEDIGSVRCQGKKGTVVFKKVYADWQSLINSSAYQAKEVARNADMNKAWENSIPVSSGPWRFQSWQKGVQITVVKNPRFTVAPAMKLDRVVFRYIADTNARFQALKAGEGQVMEPQGQLQIADFLKDSNFKVEAKAGFSYEHLDIQFGPKGAPALKAPYVRQALMQGINRAQIASALWQTIAPGLPVLNSLIFKTFENGYTQHFRKYPFNQARVIQILKGKGCTGGPDRPSAGNNDIFSCPGVGKLSFRFSTTSGNQLRALTFEIIQRQLKSVGIELVPRFQPAGLLFGTTLPSSDWDIIMFTWVQSPSSKITSKDLYACGGEQNYMNYCNRRVTNLLNQTAVNLDEAQRTKLLNQAEAVMVNDIPSIPMFVRPVFAISNKKMKGMTAPTTLEGSPWNANTWTVQ
ncbi:MAG TPA: ABC transporter substrate-binding protein [Gaiellaceae bacterium]|jgi:peptide/nickel transport system substrate-binding protein|nr:ABC transporter substrate-binding protein [Gaiellaceae bacterium]